MAEHGIPEDSYGEIIEKAVGEIRVQKMEKRRAKKIYVCEACSESIYPGEVYHHFAWRDDDGFHYFKRHAEGGCW